MRFFVWDLVLLEWLVLALLRLDALVGDTTIGPPILNGNDIFNFIHAHLKGKDYPLNNRDA